MCGYIVVYERKELWDYMPTTRDQYSRLSSEPFHHIKSLGTPRTAYRGRCAADYRPRRIPVVSSREASSHIGQHVVWTIPFYGTVALSTGGEPSAHLVRNKANLLINHVLEHILGLVALSETWLSADANDKKTC